MALFKQSVAVPTKLVMLADEVADRDGVTYSALVRRALLELLRREAPDRMQEIENVG